MPSLAEVLLAAPRRDALIGDCAKLIETHVAGLSGLRGMSFKTGLAMLKSAKPDILPRAVARLLPEFARALDPLYQKFRASAAGDFSGFLQTHSGDAIQALLGVTDARLAASQNALAKSLYGRLRGSAEAELERVWPALSQVMRNHLA